MKVVRLHLHCGLPLDYDPGLPTTPTTLLTCDGCGQRASQEHIARRLQRLEWTTRYRPIHMNALLLGGISPVAGDFLYAGQFAGEAGQLLAAVGISTEGKSAEAVLSEFQRAGFFLTHVLECPLEAGQNEETSALGALMMQRASTVATRVRRSLKPKRVILISGVVPAVAANLANSELGCPVMQDGGTPFDIASDKLARVLQLRQPLSSTVEL